MRRRRVVVPDPIQHLLAGALVGAALGLILLGIGWGRFAVQVLLGGNSHQFSPADLRLAGAYVGGLALAGALVSVLRPFYRGRGTVYVAMALAGALVMYIVGTQILETRSSEPGSLVFLLGFGALLGVAFARGLFQAG